MFYLKKFEFPKLQELLSAFLTTEEEIDAEQPILEDVVSLDQQPEPEAKPVIEEEPAPNYHPPHLAEHIPSPMPE